MDSTTLGTVPAMTIRKRMATRNGKIRLDLPICTALTEKFSKLTVRTTLKCNNRVANGLPAASIQNGEKVHLEMGLRPQLGRSTLRLSRQRSPSVVSVLLTQRIELELTMTMPQTTDSTPSRPRRRASRSRGIRWHHRRCLRPLKRLSNELGEGEGLEEEGEVVQAAGGSEPRRESSSGIF